MARMFDPASGGVNQVVVIAGLGRCVIQSMRMQNGLVDG
jgi:hypothetical protein